MDRVGYQLPLSIVPVVSGQRGRSERIHSRDIAWTSWKPCQCTGIGSWSSSLAMWWNPMSTHAMGCFSGWPLTQVSTLVPARPPQLARLLLANCSHLLYSAK